jgi:hypothetical protein
VTRYTVESEALRSVWLAWRPTATGAEVHGIFATEAEAQNDPTVKAGQWRLLPVRLAGWAAFVLRPGR